MLGAKKLRMVICILHGLVSVFSHVVRYAFFFFFSDFINFVLSALDKFLVFCQYTFENQLYASLSPAAGPCEAPGSGTLSQQKANSVLDKISAIKNIPLRQYAGKWDNTVGQSSPKSMQDALQKCGASHAELIWVDGNHNDMSTRPFNVDRLEWMLRQKRGGGGGGTPPSYTPEEHKEDEKKKDEEKHDNKDDNNQNDGKKSDNGEDKSDRVKVDLSPIADNKSSTDHKQHNTDLEDNKKEEEKPGNDSSSSSSDNSSSPVIDIATSSPSSDSFKPKSCKATRRRQKKKRAMITAADYAKRSLGEEGYAHPGPVERGILPIPEGEEQLNKKVKRGLRLSDIISNTESLKVEKKDLKQQKEEEERNLMLMKKRTPLENLKAHAGNRRSTFGSASSHGTKFGRRASR